MHTTGCNEALITYFKVSLGQHAFLFYEVDIYGLCFKIHNQGSPKTA